MMSRKIKLGVLIAVGLILPFVLGGAQSKPQHKFYFEDQTKVFTEDPDGATKIIVGDLESEGRYTIVSDLWNAGFSIPPHYHARHFETFYLVRGKAEWTVNGERHEMKPGDAVYIPAHAVHSAKTLGTEPALFIMVYSAGDYEAHLRREASYTAAERNQPEIQKMLRELNDFHPVEK
jgi:quercetin dioxygenase-like cupin family protein